VQSGCCMPSVPTCLALAFELPPRTSSQFGLLQVKPAYLTGYQFKSSPPIGLLELLAPCGHMPELLAPCEVTKPHLTYIDAW